MSARVNESTLDLINRIIREKKMSKKKVLEEAVKNFWQKIHNEKEVDFFQTSFGAWKRDEPCDETVQRARTEFNKSMQRHHVE